MSGTAMTAAAEVSNERRITILMKISISVVSDVKDLDLDESNEKLVLGAREVFICMCICIKILNVDPYGSTKGRDPVTPLHFT